MSGLALASATNRFSDVQGLEELVGVLIGAGATCWKGGTGDLVFDSDEASEFYREGIERMSQLMGAAR